MKNALCLFALLAAMTGGCGASNQVSTEPLTADEAEQVKKIDAAIADEEKSM